MATAKNQDQDQPDAGNETTTQDQPKVDKIGENQVKVTKKDAKGKAVYNVIDKNLVKMYEREGWKQV